MPNINLLRSWANSLTLIALVTVIGAAGFLVFTIAGSPQPGSPLKDQPKAAVTEDIDYSENPNAISVETHSDATVHGNQPGSPFAIVSDDVNEPLQLSVEEASESRLSKQKLIPDVEPSTLSKNTQDVGEIIVSGLKPGWLQHTATAASVYGDGGVPSVTGRLVDTHGQWIPGHEISVSSTSGNQFIDTVRTDSTGAFRFGPLASGDYMLRTQNHPFYTVSTARVRAGGPPIKLKLLTFNAAHIEGMVVDEYQQPLQGVSVIPPMKEEAVKTDADGNFRLMTTALDGQGIPLKFDLEGYLSSRYYLTPEDRLSGSAKEIVVTLRRGEFELSGTVHDEVGYPLASALVQVNSRSANLHRATKTDEYGSFVLSQLVPGTDYVLKASSTREYKAQVFENLELREGIEEPNIILPLASSGTVEGRITDTEGNPVPQLSLLVINEGKAGKTTTIVSDDNGYYKLDNFVAGPVNLRTRTAPNVMIEGVKLDPAVYTTHDFLVDKGSLQLYGSIVDNFGQNVANARVKMQFVHASAQGVRSNTTYSKTSNSSGEFLFSGIGSGERKLIFSAEGYKRKIVSLDPAMSAGPHQITLEKQKDHL